MCLFDVTVRFPFNHSHPTTNPYIFRLSTPYSTADDVLTWETAHLNPKSEIVAMSELFEAYETVSRKQSWCSTATTPANPRGSQRLLSPSSQNILLSSRLKLNVQLSKTFHNDTKSPLQNSSVVFCLISR